MTSPIDALAKRYALPYYAFIKEFRDATGFDSRRSADALAIGLYRSRGLHIIGFEQKTARGDWLREMKTPEKAEAIGGFCDYFYLVTDSPDVAKVEELPEPWGLIVVSKKIVTVKKAAQLEPKPITRSFLGAIVKQAMDAAVAPLNAINDAERAAIKAEAVVQAKRDMSYHSTNNEALLLALQKQVTAFEEASGIRINQYTDGKRLGEAAHVVQEILRGRLDLATKLDREAKDYEAVATLLRGQLARLAAVECAANH